MKTIYLDHNIVHYYVSGFPADVSAEIEINALAKIDSMRNEVRVVFSAWSLIEASRETPKEKVCQLAQFIEDREPHWICERHVLQCDEVKRFIYLRYYDVNPDSYPVKAITPSFLQIMHDLAPSSTISLTEKPRDWTLNLFEQENNRLRNKECQITDELNNAFRQGENAGHFTLELDAKLNTQKKKELNTKIMKDWFSVVMPSRAPDEKLLLPEDKEKAISYCAENYKEVLKNCPCMQAENILAGYRHGNTHRKYESQDIPDLMHFAPAIAYCDAVVTNDGHACTQLKQYAKTTGRPVIAGRLLSEIVTQLSFVA